MSKKPKLTGDNYPHTKGNNWCKGCESYVIELEDWNSDGIPLCEKCNMKYENATGHCSLSCCLGGNCDQSC